MNIEAKIRLLQTQLIESPESILTKKSEIISLSYKGQTFGRIWTFFKRLYYLGGRVSDLALQERHAADINRLAQQIFQNSRGAFDSKRLTPRTVSAQPAAGKIPGVSTFINPNPIQKPKTVPSLLDPKRSVSSAIQELKTYVDHLIPEGLEASIPYERLRPEHPSLPIDRKMMLHIHGDAFGASTGLEGHQALLVSQYLRSYLAFETQIFSENPNDDRQKEQFLQLLEGAEARKLCLDTHGEDAFACMVKTDIEGLSPGQSLMLFGGWSGNPIGHAIYYIVSKDPSANSYTFSRYNTGAGLHYHEGAAVGTKTKYLPVERHGSIDESHISNPAIWKAMAQLQTQLPAEAEMQYTEADLIDSIIPQFYDSRSACEAGRIKPNPAITDLMTPQRSGTCTWKGMTAVMRSFLPHNHYKHFKWKIKLDSLVDDYKENKDTLSTEEQSRNLLEKSLEKFSRQTVKLSKQGILSKKELQDAYSVVKALSTEIDRAKQAASQKLKEEAALVSLERTPSPQFGSFQETIEPHSEIQGALPTSINLEDVSNIVDAFTFDPHTVNQSLQHSYTSLQRLYTDKKDISVMHGIMQIISKLPFPSIDKQDPWKDLSSEEVQECMAILAKMGELFLKARMNSSNEQKISPDHVISMFTSLAIQHRLACQIPEETGIDFNITPIYYHKFVEMFGGGNGHLNISHISYSPHQSLSIQRLLEYFSEPHKEEKLTVLEGMKLQCDEENVFFSQDSYQTQTIPTDDYYERHIFSTKEKEFLSQYLSSDKKRQKLFEACRDGRLNVHVSAGEDITTVSVDAQIISLHTDIEGHILPKAYCALRKQTLVANRLLIALEEPPTARLNQEESPFVMSATISRRKPTWHKDTHLIEISRELKNQKKYPRYAAYPPDEKPPLLPTDPHSLPFAESFFQITTDHNAQFAALLWQFNPAHYSRLLQMSMTHSRTSFIQETLEHLYHTAVLPFIHLWRHPELITLSLDEIRDLILATATTPGFSHLDPIKCDLLIDGVVYADGSIKPKAYPKHIEGDSRPLDAPPHPTLSLFNTLVYFKNNFGKLEQSDWRSLLKMQLFKDSHLLLALENSPETSPYLLDFIKKGYSYFNTNGNIEGALFFLNLESLTQEYLSEIEKKHTGNPIYDGIRALLHSEACISVDAALHGLESVINNNKTKTLLYREQIRSLLKNPALSQADVKTLLKKLTFLQAHPLARSEEDFYFRLYLINTLQIRFFEINQLLQNPIERNQIFNEAVHHTVPDDINPRRTWTSVSLGIYQSDDGYFFHIAEGKLYSSTKPISTLPNNILTNPQFTNLFSQGDQVLCTFQNGIYEFTSPEYKGDTFQIKEMPDNKIIILRRHGRQWLQLLTAEKIEAALPCNKLIHNFHHWITSDFHDQIIFTDIKSDEIYCRAAISTQPDGSFHIDHVTRSVEEKQYKLVDIYSRKTGLDFLQNFERKKDILIWADSSSEIPEKIELPRFELEFSIEEVDGRRLAMSKQYPGFCISEKQYLENTGNLKDVLILENINNPKQKKVLIPFQKVQVEGTGTLRTKTSLDHTSFITPRHDSPNEISYPKYQEYDIGKKGRLIGKSLSANLHMARICLAQKRYDDFLMYLRKLSEKTSVYSQEEFDILFDIIQTLPKEIEDHDSRAYAISLYAAYLAHSNGNAYDGKDRVIAHLDNTEKNEYKEYLQELYEKQSSSIGNVGKYKLHPEEDHFLIQYIIQKKKKSPSRIIEPSALEFDMPETMLENLIHANPSCFYRRTTNITPLTNLVRPSFNEFAGNFLGYYSQAKTGTEKEKNNLKQTLAFLKNHPDTTIQSMRLILLAVLFAQENFPLINDLDAESLIKIANTILVTPKKLKRSSPSTIQPTEEHSPTEVPAPLKEKLTLTEAILLPPIISEEQIAPLFRETPPAPILSDLVTKLHPKEESETLFQAEMEALRHDIEFYAASPQTPGHSLVHKKESLATITKQVSEKIEQEKAASKQLESEILKLARKLPTELDEYALEDLRRRGISVETISLNDLMLLFLHQDGSAYRRANPSLTSEDIKILNQSLCDYLVLKTHIQQMKRCVRTTEEIKKHIEETEDEAQDPILSQLTQNLYTQLTQKRAYAPQEHPECLVFEYFSKILLREDQVLNIEKLSNPITTPKELEEAHKVLHMGMGEGKTKILLPIISLRKADRKQLPIIVAPESLYETMFDDLNESVRSAFEQRITRLEFDRNTPFNLKKLTQIHEDLLHTIEKGNSVLTTSKSIQCLRLKMVEAILESSTSSPESLEVVEKLREIMNLLGEKANAIVDEIHKVAYCRHEVRFPTKNKIQIDAKHREISIEIYKTLLSSPDLQRAMSFDFIGKSTSEAPLFTKERYEATIKRPLAEKLIARLIEGSEIDQDQLRELSQFLQSPTTNREELLDYICSDPRADLRKGKAIVDKASPEIQNLIGIIRGQLNVILPLTLKNKCDERYGFAPNYQSHLSIPYAANNIPKPEEEFGNPYEVLDYTLQLYLKKGVPFPLFKTQIANLKETAISKVLKEEAVDFAATPEYLQLKWLLKIPPEQPLKISDLDKEGLIEAAHIQFINPSDIVNYCKRYVLPEVSFDSENIHETPQGLLASFHIRQGFTGTPYNKDTYPDYMHTEQSPKVDGKSAVYIAKKSEGLPASVTILSTPQQVVQAALSTGSAAFIDLGSSLNGIPNKEAAGMFLHAIHEDPTRNSIKGVVFFDAAGELSVIRKGETKAVPFKGCGLKVGEYYTYFDQFHTTGADIKQKTDALGCVSIGKDTTFTDVAQACWRMRGLAEEQKLRFLIPTEVAILIRSQLGLEEDAPIDCPQIFLYTKQVETARKKKDNLLSTKQKIESSIQELIWRTLFKDTTIPIAEAVTLFNTHFKNIFVQEQKDSPFEQYGSLNEEIDIHSYLAQFIKKNIDILQKGIQGIENKELQRKMQQESEQLKTEIEQSLHYDLLPASVLSEPPVILDQTVEVQKEMEKETAKEKQKEQEQELEESLFRGNFQPYLYWPWTLDRTYVDPIIDLHQPGFLTPTQTIDQVFHERSDAATCGKTPIINLTQVMTSHPNFASYSPLFSNSLATSYNVCPIKTTEGPPVSFFGNNIPYAPFDIRIQVPAQQLLVIKEAGNIRAVLLDQADATFFYQQLSKERFGPTRVPPPSEQLCLYDLSLGVLQHGKEVITSEELRANPHFMELAIQAKFFNGELTYDASEIEALQQWIGDDEEKRALAADLFENKILANHPKKQADYPNSSIYKVLHKA